jgi:DNA invertase Pin-like site-specific DNA recombinase
MQKSECHKYAEQQQGWEIVKEFCEMGISGYKISANDRDAIQDIKKAATEKKFDVLLVYMFDRIGRIESETPFVVEWFVKTGGVEVWSVKQGQQRFDNHTDSLTNFIRYWQASGESINTSIRTKSGLAEAVRAGYFRGGTVPYGYHLIKNGRLNKRGHEVHDLVINPIEAEFVRLIFQKYVNEGFGIHRLTTFLSDNGIYNRNDRRFCYSSMRAIIKNMTYIGILKSGETLSDEFPHLKILDNDIFERAQAIRIARSKQHEEEKANWVPLNTKGKALMPSIAYCAHCGGKLVLTTNTKKDTRADGTVVKTKRIRYRCYNKSRKICKCDGQTEYTVEKLDGIITAVMLSLFKSVKSFSERDLIQKRYQTELESCKNKHKHAKSELNKHSDTLIKLETEIIKALNGESTFDHDVLNGLILQTKEKVLIMADSVKQYELELSNRQQHIAEIQAQYNKLISWAEMFANSPTETKKMILSCLIKRVKVSRGYEVDITFNVDYKQFCSGD